jgi:hypothetical protein
VVIKAIKTKWNETDCWPIRGLSARREIMKKRSRIKPSNGKQGELLGSGKLSVLFSLGRFKLRA